MGHARKLSELLASGWLKRKRPEVTRYVLCHHRRHMQAE